MFPDQITQCLSLFALRLAYIIADVPTLRYSVLEATQPHTHTAGQHVSAAHHRLYTTHERHHSSRTNAAWASAILLASILECWAYRTYFLPWLRMESLKASTNFQNASLTSS